MTQSNSFNFSESQQDVIFDALWRLGIVRANGTVPTPDYTRCSIVLNKIIKNWAKIGLHVWVQRQGTLFLVPNSQTYTIDGTPFTAGDNTIETVITTNSSGTTLNVSSISGMNINDSIGIQQDDGTRFWTTITALPTSTSVTLNSSLTNTASTNNTVFTYTNECTKPLHITSCQYRDVNGLDIPITMIGRDEFMELSNKNQQGEVVTSVYYNTGETTGTFFIWPVMYDVIGRLRFSYTPQLQDLDLTTDTPDFPVEWLEPLTLQLMIRIGRAYGKTDQQLAGLSEELKEALADMRMNDLDNGSIQICPEDPDTE